MLSSRQRIRIMIADDQPAYRSGLASEVAAWPEFKLVATVGGGDVTAAARRECPDVLLADVTTFSIDERRLVEAVDGATRVIFLAAYPSPAQVFAAIAAGARGYLSKISDAKEICEAIAQAGRDEIPLSSHAAEAMVSEIRLRACGQQIMLTTREREVLTLLAAGLKAPQIADRLHISAGTVGTHLRHIYENLGVGDRAAAVYQGLRAGLLE